MPYTIKETKQYPQRSDVVRNATIHAVEGLEGKIISRDTATGNIVAQFNKTIHGKVLGDRTQLHIKIDAPASGESTLYLEAYPLDAIGRKLTFGARKGVTRMVLDWFYAHLENRL